MKNNLRLSVLAAVGAVVSLASTSCYYDPAYSSASVGGSYSSGYGDGYGYGGSGFSTSVFVSTGNPQWGYDPYCYSYYDYRRRAYYDPYLNGYYPVGYRPPIVYGVPHPYGWHRGVTVIRPPAYVRNVTVVNYRNRADQYRTTNYGWARQVRQQPASQGRVTGSHNQGSGNSNFRPNTGTRPSNSGNFNRGGQSNSGSHQNTRQATKPGMREQPGTLPSRYNTPVKSSDQKARQQAQRNGNGGGGRQQGQHGGGQQKNPKNGKNQQQQEDKKGRITGYR